jgi:hypothetical protein
MNRIINESNKINLLAHSRFVNFKFARKSRVVLDARRTDVSDDHFSLRPVAGDRNQNFVLPSNP